MDLSPPTLLVAAAARRGPVAARGAIAAARGAVFDGGIAAADGLAVARALAAIIDAVLRSRVDAEPVPAAVLAVGGYGRGDLSPFSDVDVLVVAARRTPAVREAAAALARFLWDAGVEVHLTVRTHRGSRRAMERDHATASSFLDRRFVAGDVAEASRFEEDAVRPFLAERGAWLAAEKRAEARRRRDAAGGTPLGLEPDVKESPGGLRDLHVLRWLALAGGADPSAGLLPGAARADAASLAAAYGTLLRYRAALHLLAGRRQDLMDLATQRDLVARLPVAAGAGADDAAASADPVTRHIAAMAPWFAAARHVARACDRALAADAAPARAPREGLPRTAAELMGLLAGPGPVGPALRALHDEDLLARLLPEFGDVTALPQADAYHAFTVDEHTLRALETLDEATAGRGPGGARLAAEAARLASPRALRLALLLHDVGKTRGPGGHAARGAERAGEAALRLGLPPDEVRTVRRLVERHTLLGEASAVASAGDRDAPRAVAGLLGGREDLRALLLHTAADIGGVGRGAWSNWRAAQLLHFHDRVVREMEATGGGTAVADPLAGLPPRLRRAGERLLAVAPPRYAAAADPERVRDHLRLLRALRRGAPAAARAAPARDGAVAIAVAAPDRPHLFADLAGSLTLHGLDVLAAEAHTLRDGTALDVFAVAAPVRGRARLRRALEAVAAGPASSVEDALARHRRRVPRGRRTAADASVLVRRDDDGAGAAAVVRIECPDRPGLLHDLARTLSRGGFDILEVRVATLGPRALDVFHVVRAGRPPAPGPETESLLASLRAAAADGAPGADEVPALPGLG